MSTSIPPWFKTFVIVSIIWNLMGVLAFFGQVTMSAEILAELPQAEQQIYANIPVWATIAFAVAVFGGVIGCIALLLKKSMAVLFLALSLIGICIQMFHSFFISNSFAVFGPGGLIMPIIVIIWAVALLLIAKKAQSQQWLV